jgi:hypothetical protein
VVHRLDRDTSGALAFALSPPVRSALRDLFRAHRMERRYAALVEALPSTDEGQVDAPIYDVYEAGRRRLARPGEPAHDARTRWRVVVRFRAGALLEVELETGRSTRSACTSRTWACPVGDPSMGERPGAASSPRGRCYAPSRLRPSLTGARVAAGPAARGFREALAALRRAEPGEATLRRAYRTSLARPRGPRSGRRRCWGSGPALRGIAAELAHLGKDAVLDQCRPKSARPPARPAGSRRDR